MVTVRLAEVSDREQVKASIADQTGTGSGVGNDDFLGEALIDLSRYADGQTHSLKVELDQYDSTSTSDEVKGHLSIEVQVTKRAGAGARTGAGGLPHRRGV